MTKALSPGELRRRLQTLSAHVLDRNPLGEMHKMPNLKGLRCMWAILSFRPGPDESTTRWLSPHPSAHFPLPRRLKQTMADAVLALQAVLASSIIASKIAELYLTYAFARYDISAVLSLSQLNFFHLQGARSKRNNSVLRGRQTRIANICHITVG